MATEPPNPELYIKKRRSSLHAGQVRGRYIPGKHPSKRPCPFCGRLISEAVSKCAYCGLEQSEAFIEKVRVTFGDWFIHNPRNPSAPGYNWKTIEALLDQKKITADSVIRSPTTGGQWRLARQVPGLSRHFGLCWRCGQAVPVTGKSCPSCKVNLESGREPGGGSTPARSNELASLVAAQDEARIEHGTETLPSSHVHPPISGGLQKGLLAGLSLLVLVLGFALGITLYLFFRQPEMLAHAKKSLSGANKTIPTDAPSGEPQPETESPGEQAPLPVAPAGLPTKLEQKWDRAVILARSDKSDDLYQAYRLLNEIEAESMPSERPSAFQTLFEELRNQIERAELQNLNINE